MFAKQRDKVADGHLLPGYYCRHPSGGLFCDDDQFTRQMLRILLTLQHNMAGLNRKSTAELTTYYQKLITLLADECAEWLKTLDKR